MEEEAGHVVGDAKEAQHASKRTSGIAGMFPFLQRQSMDTDSDSRSSDRPRKTAAGGGKVKPGFGSKHRHSSSGDLHAGEPPSPLASGQADSPSAAWASTSYPPADVTDTLSLSQAWPGASPAQACTGTPTRSNSSSFFNKFNFKKRHSSKGSASPGVPGSPTLAGATPTHGSSISFSASGSSLSGAGGSQSPSESLCRAGNGGAVQHAGSKLGQHCSSGDPDEAEFGSCYSDALHSPNMSYQDGMYGGDTLDLRQAGFGAQRDASPMMAARQELPEVFTPGFNQLLDQGCGMGQLTPGTPPDITAMLEPTVALLTSAQLAQAGQVYEVPSMLLHSTAAQLQDSASISNAAQLASPPTAASSKNQTLLEVEDGAPVGTAAAPGNAASAPKEPQATEEPVAAEHVQVDVDMADAPGAVAPAAASTELSGQLVASPADEVDTATAEAQACNTQGTDLDAAAPEAATRSTAHADADDGVAAAHQAAATGPHNTVRCEAAVSADNAPQAAATVSPAEEPACAAAETQKSTAASASGAAADLATQCTAEVVTAATAAAGAQPPAQSAAITAQAVTESTAEAHETVTEAAPIVEPEPLQDASAACAVPSEAAAAVLVPAEACTEAALVATAAEETMPVVAADTPCDEAVQAAVLDGAASPVCKMAIVDAPCMGDSSRPASANADAAEQPSAGTAVSPPAATPHLEGAAEDSAATVSALKPTQQQSEAAEAPVDAPASEEQQPSPAAVAVAAASEAIGPQYSSMDGAPAAEVGLSSRAASPAQQEQGSSGPHAVSQEQPDGLDEAAVAPTSVALNTAKDQGQQKQHAQLELAGCVQEQPAQEQSSAALEAGGSSHSNGLISHAISAVDSEFSLAEISAATLQTAKLVGEQEQQDEQQELRQPDSPCSSQQQESHRQPEDNCCEALLQQAPKDAANVEAAADAAMQLQGSDHTLLQPQPDFEPSLQPEASEEPMLQPEASEEPVLHDVRESDAEAQALEPSSPSAVAPGVIDAASSCHSPVISKRTPGSSRRTPVSLVRESIPLFVSDPSRAVGAALVVEDSLDDQDMRQLAGDAMLAAGQAAALGAAGAAAAGVAGRLLAHGGPQRVAVGAGSSHIGGLSPVAESLQTSPIPEETSTGGSSHSRASSRYEAAAAGSPGSSPVRQMALARHSPTATGSPQLGMTPGSVYSTPTLTLGQAGAAGMRGQLGGTPASAVSSAVGSAIRDIGSAGRFPPVDRNASLAMPGMPDVSPTLALMSNMGAGAQGGSGDGSTPSLLDARAASPSAVYSTLYSTTPFRGALAALPIDAALNAPLVDSSPFNLTDDVSFDTAGFAQEAQRVAQNLAAAAAAGGSARTPAPQQAMCSPAGALLPARMMSPTDGVRDLHVEMLTKQLVDVQQRVKQLEGENLRLREQVEIYEFEKTELNSQEEMEKQARQYAEEQLQSAQMELQSMRQAKNTQHAQLVALKQEFEGLRQEAARKHLQDKEEAQVLEQKVSQLQDARNQALDRVNLLDMELTALRSNASGLQQRLTELEAAVAARDRDLQDMARIQQEAQSKLEKAVEQMIAAQTAKEHMRQKADTEAARAQQLHTERQQLLAEREKVNANYHTLKQKYHQKSSALKEMEQRLQAKEAEVAELMGMCDQLLQQQEAQR